MCGRRRVACLYVCGGSAGWAGVGRPVMGRLRYRGWERIIPHDSDQGARLAAELSG